MTTLTSSLIVRLIDQVTGPARGVEESLQRINRAGGGGSGAAPSFADNMAVAQARVGAAIEANNRAMDTARGRMVDAVAGYYLLDRTVGRTIRVAANFEEAMNGVAVVSRASGDELVALRAQAAELGRTTMFTASEVADGMGFLAMAGFNAEQVMASMENTLDLAAAGNLDLGRSADIVSNILTGYALEVSDLTRVADILTGTFTRTNTNLEQLGNSFTYAGPIAAAAGMDFAETAAVLGRLGDAGYQGSLGGTALRGAIIRLLAPTRGAEQLMEGLGVSVDDLTEGSGDLDDVLGGAEDAMRRIGLQVTDAEGRMLPFADIMAQLEGHAEDAGLMAQLFGQRAGPAMTALLRQGSESVRELTEELDALDGEAKRVAEVRMRGFNGQMRAFRSAVEGVQIAIGDALLPVMTDMIRRFTELMRPVTDFLEANPRLTAAIVGTTAALIGMKIAVAGLTFIGLLGKGGALALLAVGLRGITRLGTPIAGFFETLRMRSALATRSLGRAPGLLARIGDAARVMVRSVPGVGLLAKGLAAIGVAAGVISAPVWATAAAAVGAVAGAGFLVWRYWRRLSAIFEGVGRALGERLARDLEIIRPILDWFAPLGGVISAGWEGLAGVFGRAGEALRSIFSREQLSEEDAAAWEQWGYDIVQSIMRPFDDMIAWFSNLGSRILQAIGIIDVSGNIRWPSVPSWLGGGGGDTPQVSTGSSGRGRAGHRATGGPVWPGSSFLVGEREPELFTPHTAGRITPMSAMERALAQLMPSGGILSGQSGGGGGGNAGPVSINIGDIIVQGASDPAATARRVRDTLTEELAFAMRGLHADMGVRS
jgi:hypothetical protein